MAEIHSRRKLFRRAALAASVLVALVAGVAWYQHSVDVAAENEALEFVRINGFTSEGYRHNRISRQLAFIPRRPDQYPIGVRHTDFVGFPRDRMTNNMAQHLVNIRNLEVITLYPPDPDASGIDFAATSVSTVQSLRDLELPLSENSIALIEERFPALVIRVAERPADDSASEAENGATR